jgi:hypothetical protein
MRGTAPWGRGARTGPSRSRRPACRTFTTPGRERSRQSAKTIIPLSLAGNQSTIIGFHHDEAPGKSKHAGTLPNWHESDSKSNIRQHPYDHSTKALSLIPWTLTIESWSAPENLTADQMQAAKSNSTYHLPILQPWNAISSSLNDTSGRGFYNTTFTWPPADCDSKRHAILDLGALSNTARVWLNDQQLPPLDPTAALADISGYLREGENEVRVVVATTLGNAVRPLWSELRSSGTLALGPLPVVQEYGLVGEVSVKYE